MTDTKMCPLRYERVCLQDKCVFWDKDWCNCVILSIVRALKELAK